MLTNSVKDSVKDENGGSSLAEINGTVEVPQSGGFLRKLMAWSGPGALVAVGYMDPGNWITSIVGGAEYHYLLMSVVLISSLIAMMLQFMAAKLGIVAQKDLAQMIRDSTNKTTGWILWFVTELAIMATDMAEVIGAAIAINLLFGFPLLWGVLITAADVLLLLLLMKLGFRKIEAIVATLILVILAIFLYMAILAKPDMGAAVVNLVPHRDILKSGQLTLALGIVGATVMPHNLYLHSSISQTRKIDRNVPGRVREALKFTAWDSNIQLTGAFVVNSLLLIVGAALFFGHGSDMQAFGDLYRALNNSHIVGAIASPLLSMLFALALLASGQNSTITGTLTGQIIMEGFAHLQLPMWVQRLVTRGLALVPIIIFTIIFGATEGALDKLLVYSQVFLSVALPFSMFPLIYFTSRTKYMGEFKNARWMTIVAYLVALALTLLNVQLIIQTISSLF
ncbi:NRAMP family manganese (Mn2+) transporter [Weissella oryzae SG25]|uniref:Divalent metal cation transporter MntH n=1 Tax=Weissella oryzae (strain DSM 25784 / JCM 18191 / LMG 30913 / SG25) TaxID=1329250 RepID=A0A069CVG8_WEIOS|nr:Nramp family divalent metal transporter [Weissella oryzae]GAK31372.1 NRAMP family manganese (Mn2+) transporter [Weissella oryzae SG25]